MKPDYEVEAATGLRPNAIGWLGVFFMVVATNGPLTTLAGGIPVSFALSNGIGVAGSFLTISLLYLLFAVGLSAMMKYTNGAGAFYAYITRGLGVIPGIAAAVMAIFSYNAMLLACYAMVGFFTGIFVTEMFGVEMPWWSYALVVALLCHYLCVRGIEFSGRILLVLMALEVVVILVCDGLIMNHGIVSGGEMLKPFTPSVVFGDGFGPSLVFVVAAFMGFETAAIYAGEVRNPTKSIPRAMYLAIIFIGIIYTGSVWLMLQYYGYEQAVAVSANNPGDMWMGIVAALAGGTAAKITTALLLTSLFAAILSFTNVVTRYWHVMAIRGIVWEKMGHVHTRYGSPAGASWGQFTLVVVILCGFALLKLDPMQQVFPFTSLPAAVGVITVQCMAAIAVVVFFLKNSCGESVFTRLIAPGLSAVALAVFVVLILNNLHLLAGKVDGVIYLVATSVLIAGGLGALYSYCMRVKAPQKYLSLSDLVKPISD